MAESNVYRLGRRGLLAGVAGAGVGLAASAVVDSAGAAPAQRSIRKADVVVVGAGLAGLTAARRLVAAGHSVIVLEARDRVGGRTLNHHLGGGKVIEIGGQWVGPTQDHVLALGKEVGVGTFKTYNTGKNLYFSGKGSGKRYASDGPLGPVPPDLLAVADLELVITRLNRMATQVPVDAPWTAKKAAEWDAKTVASFVNSTTLTSRGKALVDLSVGSVMSAGSGEVSLLYLVSFLAAATNGKVKPDFTKVLSVAGGAEDSRFVGGSQEISIRVADQLDGRVHLGQPVRRIVTSGSGVQVATDDYTVEAKHVIVTVPPALAGLIAYEPGLPPLQAQLSQRFPQGSVIKVQAVYDTPFWREEGLTGQVVSLTGPVKITFDNSPPDGSPGVLVGFLEGEEARKAEVLSPAQRRALVVGNFTDYFGSRAASPLQYVEQDWSREVWTRGGYSGFGTPGALTGFGEGLRAPAGRIHWAGGERSEYWFNSMDGAVRSGEKAAAEVVADF
ncbi:MAG: aofH 1 [Marmoricola sp.]|nr:aofH 1 [Marmoricola sp.]